MTQYEDLCDRDWVQYFYEKFESGEVRFDKDGKFKVFGRLVHDSPWIHTPSCKKQDMHGKCGRYQEIFAKKIGFIHSVCHSCWKVVVKPNTVEELFKLHEYQFEVDLPAKCGIEVRNFVPRLYGGYFYNRSIEQGRECHRLVGEAIHKTISKDIEVILKRGCTEFEMQYGASDKWKMIPDQKRYEEKFETLFVQDAENPDVLPDYIIASIKRRWLQWAAEATPPDLTYLKFTGGKYLTQHADYVTYHEDKPLIHVVGR